MRPVVFIILLEACSKEINIILIRNNLKNLLTYMAFAFGACRKIIVMMKCKRKNNVVICPFTML